MINNPLAKNNSLFNSVTAKPLQFRYDLLRFEITISVGSIPLEK